MKEKINVLENRSIEHSEMETGGKNKRKENTERGLEACKGE